MGQLQYSLFAAPSNLLEPDREYRGSRAPAWNRKGKCSFLSAKEHKLFDNLLPVFEPYGRHSCTKTVPSKGKVVFTVHKALRNIFQARKQEMHHNFFECIHAMHSAKHAMDVSIAKAYHNPKVCRFVFSVPIKGYMTQIVGKYYSAYNVLLETTEKYIHPTVYIFNHHYNAASGFEPIICK